MIQVQEEVSHAKILRRYLLDNDYAVKMLAIDQPDKTFSNDLEPLQAGLEHERYITNSINECYQQLTMHMISAPCSCWIGS